MHSQMLYYCRYRRLEQIAETARLLKQNFSPSETQTESSIINRVIKLYNNQRILGNIPPFTDIIHLFQYSDYLDANGKRLLNSLGKMYEYEVNLFNNQIYKKLNRLQFSSQQALDTFNKIYVNLSKDFKYIDYKKLWQDNLHFICNTCEEFNCISISDLMSLCNKINTYEEKAYKTYLLKWENTQGKKVEKMSRLRDNIMKQLPLQIWHKTF